MSSTLKIFFVSLIVLLLGVIAYLGWTYYSQTKGLSSETELSSNKTALPSGINKSQGERYEGLIFCMLDVEKGTPLTSCENFGIVMNDDKVYELIENGVDASVFNEKDEVTVLGVIKPGISPLGPPDGTMYVFEISKL